MNDSKQMSDVHKMDIKMNIAGLALALTIIMAALTHWVIKMYTPADPLVSIMIALVNGAVGITFALNGNVWATQFSGFTKHEPWDKEQIKLALIGMVLTVGTLCAGYWGLRYGNTRVDTVFGGMMLLLSWPVTRLCLNAIRSRGIANLERPTILA